MEIINFEVFYFVGKCTCTLQGGLLLPTYQHSKKRTAANAKLAKMRRRWSSNKDKKKSQYQHRKSILLTLLNSGIRSPDLLTRQALKHSQHTISANGAFSRRSCTRSSTLLKYRPNILCFSSVFRVPSPSSTEPPPPPPPSAPPAVLRRSNAPSGLLGLRCNPAAVLGALAAAGVEGVSGIR